MAYVNNNRGVPAVWFHQFAREAGSGEENDVRPPVGQKVAVCLAESLSESLTVPHANAAEEAGK